MPVVSSFFGIVIRMFYREQDVPSFHAEYLGQQSTFSFEGERVAGTLQSRTALRLIKEWSSAHRPELDAGWECITARKPVGKIEPLD